MKKLLILVFAFCLLPTHAANWIEIDDYTYLDQDSIKNYVDDNGKTWHNKKIFWVKHIYNENLKSIKLTKKINQIPSDILVRNIINNDKDSICHKAITIYDTDGNIIESYTNHDSMLRWESIVPESYGAIFQEIINNDHNEILFIPD